MTHPLSVEIGARKGPTSAPNWDPPGLHDSPRWRCLKRTHWSLTFGGVVWVRAECGWLRSRGERSEPHGAATRTPLVAAGPRPPFTISPRFGLLSSPHH